MLNEDRGSVLEVVVRARSGPGMIELTGRSGLTHEDDGHQPALYRALGDGAGAIEVFPRPSPP